MKVFSKIPNNFLIPEGENKSLLKKIGDEKALLILHNLNILVNRRNYVLLTVEGLIKICGYSINDRTKKQFKEILFKFKEEKLIDFKEKNFKTNESIIITIIDIEDKFFTATDEEIDLIEEYSSSQKEFLNLVKLYFYLKARTYKKPKEDEYVDGGKAEVCYPSYKLIAEELGIGQNSIVKCIKRLKDLGLIDYKNAGQMYKSDDIKKIKKECSNIYVIKNISQCNCEYELREGLKQYKQAMRNKGYVVESNKLEVNKKKLGGHITQLKRKRTRGTITEEELLELEEYEATKEILKENSK